MAAAAATNVRQQQYGLIVARLRSSANNYHGTDCRARMNDKMIFSTMLLSYRYLYMRTRGHEASPSRAKPNRIPPGPTRRTQYTSTGSFRSALLFGIQTYPKIVQLFPPKELLANAFFLSFPVLFRLFRFPPLSNNQFHSNRCREGARRLF